MASTHPNEKLISLYASGEASEGVSLAVAAHLTYCSACRARVADAEAVAGALLLAEEPEAAGAPDFEALLARLHEAEEAAAKPVKSVDAGPLPASVAEMVGIDFGDIPWRFRLPGVSEYEIAAREGDTISLLRVKPGVAIPQHTHHGEEITVVFSGVLEDGDTSYGVGAMSVADHEVNHHPRAGEGDVCICLAVVSGGLRFTGIFGRALNIFS